MASRKDELAHTDLSILRYRWYIASMKTTRTRKLIVAVATLLTLDAAFAACRTTRNAPASPPAPVVSVQDATISHLVYGGTFTVSDAASPLDCGVTHAVCGKWTCTDGTWGLNCNARPTLCGTYSDAGPEAGLTCDHQGMCLSNGILGSAAQQVPGGVFCPGIPFSVNVLTDPSNCGYCGHNCNTNSGSFVGAGIFCLNGTCGVP